MPTVNTDVASPASTEPPPLTSSAICWSVLPAADGKSVSLTCCAARTLLLEPAGGRHLLDRVLRGRVVATASGHRKNGAQPHQSEHEPGHHGP